jgi:hypothetical protein
MSNTVKINIEFKDDEIMSEEELDDLAAMFAKIIYDRVQSIGESNDRNKHISDSVKYDTMES